MTRRLLKANATIHGRVPLVKTKISWRRGSKGSRDQGFKGLFSLEPLNP
jgi:hypothetical protein